ncbi:translation initiation factor IF-2 [Buchnera aphidicola (Takecallis taiwana)]|uniref:translation initiation factor IF-2 n=1 Tax=Buchnera aphidicola TaxID=9 RepID=UPI0031B724F4
MNNMTLQALSYEMNITISELIKNFSNIGIIKNKNDYVTVQEKKLLLHYLSSKNELSLRILRKKNNRQNVLHDIQNIKEYNTLHTRERMVNITPDTVHQVDHEIYSESLNKSHNKKPALFHENNSINNNIHLKVNLSNKNNNFTNASNTTVAKNNISVKHTTHYKKNTINTVKKNKITSSNRIMNKKLSSGNHLKKIVNLNELDAVHNIVEENINIDNKKEKINNKNHISSYNNDKNILKNQQYRLLRQGFVKPNKHILKKIVINNTISILELANKLSIKTVQLIEKILSMGNVVTENQIIDQETAQLIIEEMGHEAVLKQKNNSETLMLQESINLNHKFLKKNRPPVVTIMGHVDHGKTSLLDYIRSTKVALHESGGITQHIGAYCVKTQGGLITFLDTPGHAAFTAMRARGAQVTDIVVLVVAADDGVKPQTIEAIQHAKSAGVPILVAINKIDKLEADPESIKKELLKFDIMAEEWGGEVIFINISAVTGQGVDELLQAILLQAEILELSARVDGMANGVILEARLDKYRGPIATILIREGKLQQGHSILCGIYYGKVRSMKDPFGCSVQDAGPSIPVEVLGLSGIPSSGDIVYVVQHEKQAREIVLYRKNQLQKQKIANIPPIDVHHMFNNLNKNKNSILNLILKSDVKGSLEAITHVIQNLSNQYVCIKIISANVGNITETDVAFAVATQAMIIGFNVTPNVLAKRAIKINNIDARYYSVIYHLIDDVKLIVSGMIAPQYKTVIIGSAEIRDIFKPTKSIFIAGCMVISGIIKRIHPIHILRNKTIIYKGELESLRRFKEDVKSVGIGKECGIGIKDYNDICIGDIIESFKTIEIKHSNSQNIS